MVNVGGGSLNLDWANDCFLYGGAWENITATPNSQNLTLFTAVQNNR